MTNYKKLIARGKANALNYASHGNAQQVLTWRMAEAIEELQEKLYLAISPEYHDRVVAEAQQQVHALEAKVERVRKEAEEWRDAPEREVAPCTGVGKLFLAILDGEKTS